MKFGSGLVANPSPGWIFTNWLICASLGAPLIDHQDNLGRTALLIAAADKNLDLVQLLLERGANASLPDKEGKTILDYLEPAE